MQKLSDQTGEYYIVAEPNRCLLSKRLYTVSDANIKQRAQDAHGFIPRK